MYIPSVSVIINTYNRGDHLRRLLDALTRQTYNNFEVIVVNGPSTDHTKEVIRHYRRAIRSGECPVTNLSVSRNIGLRKASGEIIAFIDDDAVPQDINWIANAVRFFEDKKVGIVSGTVYYLGKQVEFRYGWLDIWGRSESVQDDPVIYDDPKGERYSYGQGCNVFFRAKAISKVGGFDEYYAYFLDEGDLEMRIIRDGYTFRYAENMAVLHERAPGPFRKDAFHNNLFVIARSQGYFIMKATEGTGKTKEECKKIAIKKAMEPRIEGMKDWVEQQIISQKEYKEMADAVRSGFEQGIRDSKKKRKLNDSDKSHKKHFKKYDKTVSSGHQNLCLLCESGEEKRPEYQSLIIGLLGKGNHIYVVSPGEKTKLELINGVNYCTVNTGLMAGSREVPIQESYAVFLILQELKQTFGTQKVVSQIQDKPVGQRFCYSINQLYVTGEADKTEGMIVLRRTGIQFGPYITLNQGKYEVLYTGKELKLIDDYHVTSDMGKRLINIEMIYKNDNQVRYSFVIDEYAENVEFVAANQRKSPAYISGIEFRVIS